MQLSLPGLVAARIQSTPPLTPFIKWPGGKSGELAAIAAAAPPIAGRLIDPFVGGGSVLLATPATVLAWANDACRDLVRLYVGAARSDAGIIGALDAVAQTWDALGRLDGLVDALAAAFLAGAPEQTGTVLSGHLPALRRMVDGAGPGLADPFEARLQRDLPTKFRRMRHVQAALGRDLSTGDLHDNVEGAIRAAVYMAVRHRYNEARRRERWDPWRTADFLFLREFAYAAMFRFNARDEFNVPYGGVSYNRKSLADKVAEMRAPAMVERLAATEWRDLDFQQFLAEAAPGTDDFVFVDPPYDSDFSAYDNQAFGAADQLRLRDVLETLPSRVMVVIKDTPLVRALYGTGRWSITEAAKTYMWTIKSRNDRSATHLTITNH